MREAALISILVAVLVALVVAASWVVMLALGVLGFTLGFWDAVAFTVLATIAESIIGWLAGGQGR